MKITKAIVLCAGFGKRLQPLTLSNPKPLLKIGNTTLLSNTLKVLEKFGIEQVVINVHYLGHQIINYVKNKNFNMKITIVNESDRILDTGGGVLNVIEYFSDKPFAIINPDTIWSLNYLNELRSMEKDIFANEIKCSLLIVNKNKSFDKSFKGDFNLKNQLISRNDPDNLRYIYTGFQLINPDVFGDINLKIFSINKIWDKLIKNKVLIGKVSNIDFLHVSNLAIYKSLLKKYFRH